MDEPSNFLDIDALEALESLLIDYEGTILFVSHDRRFIENIATKIIEISNQSIVAFNGGYREFLDRDQEPSRNFVKDELLKVEMKLSEVISKISESPSEELDQEFQALITERKRLQDQLKE
jgi:pleuromutilin/lincosamide/streptogramin A transport system ATP-binding/permease protein